MPCFLAKADRRSWGSIVSGKRITYELGRIIMIETRRLDEEDDDDRR